MCCINLTYNYKQTYILPNEMVIETDSRSDLSAEIEMDSRTVYMSAWPLETWKAVK